MQTRKAREGTPRDIVPRYGMSLIIGLDIRLAVVAETAQQVARASMTWWKLHTAYCLQSSGEAECMIRNLTQTLAKLSQETSLRWVDILPMVLLKVRCSPMAGIGFPPFEILECEVKWALETSLQTKLMEMMEF